MATEEVKIKALLENDKQYFPATKQELFKIALYRNPQTVNCGK